MLYLGLALFAEGPSDHSLLSPLLRRVCESLCASRGRAPVEIPDEVLRLRSPRRVKEQDRASRILEAAKDALGAWSILFVHTDGGCNVHKARIERVEPGLDLVAAELGERVGRGIGVIPVRETEAWAMVDGEALRRAFGVSLKDSELGIPERARDVESIQDPKRSLDDAWKAAKGKRRRKARSDTPAFLQLVGERIRLDLLQQVPAFQVFQNDLIDGLEKLGFLDASGP